MVIFGTIISVFIGSILGAIVGDIIKTTKNNRNGSVYMLSMLCSLLVLAIGVAMSVIGFI